MSARGFGSVVWAGAVAGAALGFYLVSLRVASERAALEDVESNIVRDGLELIVRLYVIQSDRGFRKNRAGSVGDCPLNPPQAGLGKQCCCRQANAYQ